MTDVLVVGGGIAGCAVAAACVRRGMKVILCERGSLASGASGLGLALIPQSADPSPYLELHLFTGGAFFLDRTPPDHWPARRIDARAAAAAFAVEARSHGASVRTGCAVQALLERSGTVVGALTDGGEIRSGTTVLAAGTSSWGVCAALPVSLPIRPRSAELVVAAAGVELDGPVVEEEGWAALDEGGRLWAVNPDSIEEELPALPIAEPIDWRAIEYPEVSGGGSYGAAVEGVSGLLLAVGHGLRGIAEAPAIAATIATTIEGGGNA